METKSFTPFAYIQVKGERVSVSFRFIIVADANAALLL